MPTIDFSQVKGLDPIPVGEYLASITSASDGMSSNNNPKIDIQWKVEDGPFAGRIVFDNLTFTEASAFRVKNTLLALDFPEDFKGDVNGEMLVGKTAYIVVEIETSTQLDDSGEPYPPRNRVKKCKSLKARKRAK